MLEKGIIEISKYVTKSEILDFSNNDFIFDWFDLRLTFWF
jgi:hypothetical protein